jgi:hypothetical protein
MGKAHRSQTAQIYRKFEDTDRLMIEVALDNYEDIFNEWDPAPFKRRDIDPDLRAFFEECSDEVSLKHPLAIVFFLPKGEIDMEKQQKCVEGLRNFFRFNKYLAEKEIVFSRKRVMKHLLIGALFLVIAVLFEHQFETDVLFDILGQGLFIGGWVFAWEAVSTVAFKHSELTYSIREWDRFIDAPIVFKKERGPDQSFE